MITSRAVEDLEQEYTARGEAFFHVSGKGHEGIAVVNSFLTPDDWVQAHYRDKSLLLARGVTPYDYFLALFNKEGSSSQGRQMNAHMSAPQFNVLSLGGPVGNSHPHAAGVAAALKDKSSNAIAVGLVGDGSTQQGEFLEALTLSIQDSLPLLTVIEDNQYAISTHTKGKTFFQMGDTQFDSFLGCPITRIDGRDVHSAYDTFELVIDKMRKECAPAIVVFSVDRLDSHTNADDHKVYRTQEDIQQIRKTSDPIIRLLMHLHNEDADKTQARMTDMVSEEVARLRTDIEKAQRAKEPQPIFTAKSELPAIIKEKAQEQFEEGDNTMILSIREVLRLWLEKDERVFLYGEDIEDPKGDVFGVTKGLSTKYPNRVVNSPLSESLILGTSIGRALTGLKPVAFLQFADFFPLAFNQTYSELGSIYWRSGGEWKVPVIVMVTGGGYKPGLGPFHSASMEGTLAHIPGIDVFAPYNAADAAGLLNAAFMSDRPTLFFYPKNLLNTKIRNISGKSLLSHVVMPGTARIVQEGDDITMVGFGNTITICEKAAHTLSEHGKSSEIIDLRTISPLDHETIIKSVKKTRKLLVVHEENGSMGVGAEVLARVGAEVPSIIMKRVTRSDTHVPCNFINHLEVLPSYKRVLETATSMLNGTITWDDTYKEQEEGVTAIEAVGSSPSDETLTIVEWTIKPGETIKSGGLILEGEANKAEVSIKSPVSGTVKELLVEEGDTVDIGTNICLIESTDKVYTTITKEMVGIPSIAWDDTKNVSPAVEKETQVYIGHVNSALGSKLVDNEQIAVLSPEWTAESIKTSTGIVSRHWLGENETLESITVDAAKKTLKEAGMKITDISGIICATGTHEHQTPSLAAMVQYRLLEDISDETVRKQYQGYAYDVSAACSGYVFGLASAYNRLMVDPTEKILLLTGENLSAYLDMKDYQTGPIFADAATATMVLSTPISGGACLSQPVIKTIGEPAEDLVVPTQGYIQMNGIEVYKVAVDNLKQVAEGICKSHNLTLDDIDLIVPHQANLKVIRGAARRLKIGMDKFYVNIDRHGNTSSSTVPICLTELDEQKLLKDKKILVIVFGGGYTFGGVLLQF